MGVGRSGEMRVDFGQWGWFPQVGSIDIGTEQSVAGNDKSDGDGDGDVS